MCTTQRCFRYVSGICFQGLRRALGKGASAACGPARHRLGAAAHGRARVHVLGVRARPQDHGQQPPSELFLAWCWSSPPRADTCVPAAGGYVCLPCCEWVCDVAPPWCVRHAGWHARAVRCWRWRLEYGGPGVAAMTGASPIWGVEQLLWLFRTCHTCRVLPSSALQVWFACHAGCLRNACIISSCRGDAVALQQPQRIPAQCADGVSSDDAGCVNPTCTWHATRLYCGGLGLSC